MPRAKGIPSTDRKRKPIYPGQVFGSLTVLWPSQRSNSARKFVVCRCECDVFRHVDESQLRCGKTKSCGCYKVTKLLSRSTTHRNAPRSGLSREYVTWAAIIQRCTNPKNPNFKTYGGRGIFVTERWLGSFKNFLADMGHRPSPKHSIDRIDNDRGYCKENCRWATHQEQCQNKRTSVYLTINGFTKNIGEWASISGVKRATILYRYHQGWDHESCVYHKPHTKHKSKNVL